MIYTPPENSYSSTMIAYYNSPFGLIKLQINKNDQLSHLYFISSDNGVKVASKRPNNHTLTSTIEQLEQYFLGQRTVFNLPLVPQGTIFQQKVWQALQSLSYGETQSYTWLAKKINSPKAVRAVGRANGANPISIIIPCHRIIGANGKLTGYAGGLSLKEKLLTLEGALFTPLDTATKKGLN